MARLAGCIDRGLAEVQVAQQQIRGYVAEIQAVAQTLEPENGTSQERQRQFEQLQQQFTAREDPVYQKMAKQMANFQAGLFVGDDVATALQDNLDLERWFRHPKGHERRIHGHRHAGVRIVQEGPTLLLALDAHVHHPGPFQPADLQPYRRAQPPPSQQDAMARRKIMRKARSTKKRRLLLAELELRYNSS